MTCATKRLHRFTNAAIEIEVRHRYLHIVATGVLQTVAEVDAYHAVMEKVTATTGCRRALVDVRGQSEPGPAEVRARAWKWLSSGKAFERLAYLIPESAELEMARINMMGLSHGISIRSFKAVTDARRWLVRPHASERKATRGVTEPESHPGPPSGDDESD